MKDWIFISDFDGTLTHKDFYWMVIDKYLPEKGRELFKAWKEGKFTDAVFLGMIFASMDRSQEEIDQDIRDIPVDEAMEELIRRVQASGGDFLILSAGNGYYIQRILAWRQLASTPMISNPGVYQDRGIRMTPDPNSPFYSPRYGVDKEKVVLDCKQHYKKVFYAGDSEPDLKAAMHADITFAKDQLQDMLLANSHPFIPFGQLSEVLAYLEAKGMIKP